MKCRKSVALLVGATILCLQTSAFAIQVGPGAFGGGTTIESFEGLSPGPNIPLSGNFPNGFLVPGNVAPFTFASGVAYTAPVPNTNDGQVMLVGDYALGDADWGLLGNGTINSAADVVSGTAYLGDCCPEGTPARFTFPSNMLRVGIYATDAPGSVITMSAYDSNGAFLESVSVNAVPLAAWGSNFLGIQNAAGIRSIALASAIGSTQVPVYDVLMFERVPEPSTLAACGLAVCFTLLWRGRRTA